MSIKFKLGFLVSIVSFAFILLILFYILISNFINQIIVERRALEAFSLELNSVFIEASKIPNTPSLEQQLFNYNKQIEEMQLKFKTIKNFRILPKSNLKIQVALENIQSREVIIMIQVNEFKDRTTTLINKAKILFKSTNNISILSFYNYFLDQKNNLYQESILYDIHLLFNQLIILEKNINDSVQIIKNEFAIIEKEIEKLINKTVIIASILIGIILAIAVIFSIILANRIVKKIQTVQHAVKTISQGDFSVKLNFKTHDEFQLLSHNFNIFVNDLMKNVDLLTDFMNDFSKAISEKINIPQIFKMIVDSTMKYINADGAAILMLDSKGKILKVESCKGIFPPPYPVSGSDNIKKETLTELFISTPIKIGETILGKVAQSGEIIFIRDTENDDQISQNTWQINTNINSIIIIPLIIAKRIFGVLSVVKIGKNNFLTHLDFTHIKAFTDYAALTIDNFIKYKELTLKHNEMEIAKKIQIALLPQLPKTNNYELSAEMLPADEVGGDYYDFYKGSDGRNWYAIGDVSGHGLISGLIMLMAQSSTSTIIKYNPNIKPKELYIAVNSLLKENIRQRLFTDHFMTLSFLVSDSTGNFTYIGSHIEQIIYRADKKKCELVKSGGLWAGIRDNELYIVEKSFKLNTGDMLVLYTDGLIEAMNSSDEQFDIKRLMQLIITNYNNPVEIIMENILKEVFNFMNKQNDDITLFLVKKS